MKIGSSAERTIALIQSRRSGRYCPDRRPTPVLVGTAIHRLKDPPERGGMQPARRETVEVLETHDERASSARIDAVRLAIREDRSLHMHPLDAHLECHRSAAQRLIPGGESMRRFHYGFKLDRALRNARRSHCFGRYG